MGRLALVIVGGMIAVIAIISTSAPAFAVM